MTTAITTPSIDQQVMYMSTDTALQAVIVNLWEDGPVDIVVNDPSVPEEFKVRRMPYVPFGTTYVPPVAPQGAIVDPRYVTQITGATGAGVAAAPITSTAPTEGADGADGTSTEPLVS